MEIRAQGAHLQVWIDGTLIFDVTDATLADGTLALYSWGNNAGRFDNVVVTDLNGIAPAVPRIQINFQPTSVAVPPSYLKDDGAVYDAVRGYGWEAGNIPSISATGIRIRINGWIRMSSPMMRRGGMTCRMGTIWSPW